MCPYKVKGCFLLFGILFLIVDIALHTQDQDNFHFLSEPNDTEVPCGETMAYFYCRHNKGGNADWNINGIHHSSNRLPANHRYNGTVNVLSITIDKHTIQNINNSAYQCIVNSPPGVYHNSTIGHLIIRECEELRVKFWCIPIYHHSNKSLRAINTTISQSAQSSTSYNITYSDTNSSDVCYSTTVTIIDASTSSDTFEVSRGSISCCINTTHINVSVTPTHTAVLAEQIKTIGAVNTFIEVSLIHDYQKMGNFGLNCTFLNENPSPGKKKCKIIYGDAENCSYTWNASDDSSSNEIKKNIFYELGNITQSIREICFIVTVTDELNRTVQVDGIFETQKFTVTSTNVPTGAPTAKDSQAQTLSSSHIWTIIIVIVIIITVVVGYNS